MDKLFRVLLNRELTNKEKNRLYNKNFTDINNYILTLEEYKLFIESNSQNVKNILNKEFGSFKNNSFINKMMELLRNNNYNYDILKQNIKNKKNEINIKINNFIYNVFNKQIDNLDFKEFYLIFFENKFNYKQFEFIIVNSDFFNKLVDKEINKFYNKKL